MYPPTFNPAWRHQPTITPLEALRTTAECLERGEVVPGPAATIVASALRQYLHGHTDITTALGLRPRRGGRYETPLALEQRTRRDALITLIYQAQLGKRCQKAQSTAKLISNPPSEISETDVLGYLMELQREHGGDLPKSSRQIMRVVDGENVHNRR